jgi:hypothetical protein
MPLARPQRVAPVTFVEYAGQESTADSTGQCNTLWFNKALEKLAWISEKGFLPIAYMLLLHGRSTDSRFG